METETQLVAPEAVNIIAAHRAAQLAAADVRRGVEDALKLAFSCGTMIKAAREKIPSGQWIAWVETNIAEIGRVRAWQYLKLAMSEEGRRLIEFGELPQSLLVQGCLGIADQENEPKETRAKSSAGEGFSTRIQWLAERCRIDLIPRFSLSDRRVLKDQLKPLVDFYSSL
jgi:hypothetical protein